MKHFELALLWLCDTKPPLVFSSAVLQLFEHDGSAKIVYLLCAGGTNKRLIFENVTTVRGPRGFSMWIQNRKSTGIFFWNRSHHSKAFPPKGSPPFRMLKSSMALVDMSWRWSALPADRPCARSGVALVTERDAARHRMWSSSSLSCYWCRS